MTSYVIERVSHDGATRPVAWAETHDDAVGLITDALVGVRTTQMMAAPSGFGGFHVWRLDDGGRVQHVSWHPILASIA